MVHSWKTLIAEETAKPYFQQLSKFLVEDGKKHTIYPEHQDVFNAFKYCPLDKVKTVILGQDCYISEGQAHGLAFSVLPGVDIPPSLKNIYKEINSDLQLNYIFPHGCLVDWAKQGVLLLNSVMTVRAGQSGSHKDKGWELFSSQVISTLNQLDHSIVYLLWGNYAKSKAKLLNNPKQLVLQASHPSPLSAHTGWFGCRHFSQANNFLIQNKLEPIDWKIK
jgi:uracil-DNA glycosylase